MRLLAQQVATSSRQATAGSAKAFDRLRKSVDEFDKNLGKLNNGDGNLPSAKALLGSDLSDLGKSWSSIRESANTIYTVKSDILFLNDVAKNLNESIPVLQKKSDQVVAALVAGNAPANQIALAQKQSWLAERIARNIDRMLKGDIKADSAADQFNLDTGLFGSVLQGLLNGSNSLRIARVENANVRNMLTDIAADFEYVNSSVDEVYQASEDLIGVNNAADTIVVDAPKLMQKTAELSEKIAGLAGQRAVSPLVVWGSGAVALLALVLLGLETLRSTRRRLAMTAQTNDQNQQAILRLLDEIGGLADGDLTTNATVTEDFTGAIADAVNYAIGQLRVLVSSINDTSVSVAGSAQQNQQATLKLAEASAEQAHEIMGASQAVNDMANTIDHVSSNAAESAAVAERSVEIASSGGQMVRNTITGMDNIREQIQETSKRIKRLGESSQEIGDIVSLIHDIADQTNILALNAAIQASMAGDAGRGFAVVADEVQRLAERSGAATKQIEALVKTIQSDTNEAVISMEQTTTEVVRGAHLAQDAGVALEEIENVSTNLAELIQNISNAAKQQASSAGQISNTMTVVQEIASQTSKGTKDSAASVGELAGQAEEMRKLVEGFKLPQDGQGGHY
jgi:twitching motility protein PilJ